MARTKFQDQLQKSFIGYVSFILVTVMLLYLGGFALNFFTVVVRSNQESNRDLSKTLQDQYDACEREMGYLAQLPEMGVLLTEGTSADRAFVSQALYRFANEQDFRPYFALIDRFGQTVCSSFNLRNQSSFESSVFVKSAMARLDRAPAQMLCFVCTAPLTGDQDCVYSFCRMVPGQDGEALGYLFLNLREERFRSCLRGLPQDVLITDAYDNIIYTTLDPEEDPMDKLPSGKYSLPMESAGIFQLDGEYYYGYAQTVTAQGIRVYTLTSLEGQVKAIGYSLVLFLLLFLVLILIIIVLTRAFARKNARELGELTQAVKALDREDGSGELSPQCSEEYQQLYTQFRQLVRNNNQLQERRRQMEVRQLEEQFNPHFVFNVMETVRYQIRENPETASDMLLSFANLMRYSINYGHSKVDLETDIEYINDYLLLQKIRYNNRLQFELNIPDELLECQVPKLLLQPIIENSIKHGFRQDKVLEISVTAERVGEDLRFTVRDNGAGITSERLAAIRESFSLELDSGFVKHIGLYNIQKVTSLLYGPGYGLEIESDPGVETRVILTIPCEMEE